MIDVTYMQESGTYSNYSQEPSLSVSVSVSVFVSVSESIFGWVWV